MISQTVGETVVMGEVYTLLIDIGWRFDESFTGTADLLINEHTYARSRDDDNVRLDGTLGQSGVPEGTMPAQIAVKVLHVPRGDGVGSPEERAPKVAAPRRSCERVAGTPCG